MSEPTYKTNVDGSITMIVDGTETQYGKMADTLGLKGLLKTKTEDWDTERSNLNTKLAEANRIKEESHQELLKGQAAAEQLQERYKDYDAFKAKAGELTTTVETHATTITNHEKELADRIRFTLINVYKVKEDSLKDKDLSQLRNLEESAKILGASVAVAAPAKYDGGPGGPGAGSAPEKDIDRAKRIIEEHEAAGHRMGGKGSLPPPPKTE